MKFYQKIIKFTIEEYRSIFKKLSNYMCVWGKKILRDVEGILKKEFYIYIYIWVQVSVCHKETKKKKTNLLFQIEGSIRPGEEKQIQAGKISQFKSVKALVIVW